MANSVAVIFDLGRVLVSFDHHICYRALAADIGVEALAVKAFVEGAIRPRFDRGLMTVDEVHDALESEFGHRLNRDRMVGQWADVFQPIPKMISWLEGLAQRVPLALLSNTDPIHLPWCREQFGFFHHFSFQALSYEVGAAKPEPAIYRAALSGLGMAAGQCCFIDDVADYVQVAQDIGLFAVHHTEPATTIETVETWLAAMGRG